MGWVSPTGFLDPDVQWSDEPLIYDNDTLTFGYDATPADNWSSFVELTHIVIACTKVQFHALYNVMQQNSIDVDVWDNDATAWFHVYEGAYLNGFWVEKNLDMQRNITKARVRFYNDFLAQVNMRLNEFDFWVVEAAVGGGSSGGVVTAGAARLLV